MCGTQSTKLWLCMHLYYTSMFNAYNHGALCTVCSVVCVCIQVMLRPMEWIQAHQEYYLCHILRILLRRAPRGRL